MPDRSVQTVITSPPYWGLRAYGVRGEIGAERRLQTYLSHLSDVFGNLRRVVRKDGTLWLVMGDAFTSGNRRYRDVDSRHPVRGMVYRPKNPAGLKEKDLIGLPWRVALLLQSLGWYLRTEIIWHKPNAMPESVGDRPWRNHEYLFLFSNSANYYFDRDALNPLGSGDSRRSVWSIPVGTERDGKGHAAVFPMALVQPCVSSSSRAGDVVLDPFAGSGTVGVVAVASRRRFVGFDLKHEYVDYANTRIRQAVLRREANDEVRGGHPIRTQRQKRAIA